MANRIAFLGRPTHIVLILLVVMCLLASAEAQHGGGGGHSAGGHLGGGHSSGRQTGGGRMGGRHFSWLHLGLGNRSARRAGRLGKAGTPDASLPPEPVKGATPVRAAPLASTQPAPPRSLWFPVFFPHPFAGNSSFFSSRFRNHSSFFFGRFPCVRTSGCFFNGLTQVCFFEPALPLFFFSPGFDPFLSGFGFGGSSFGMGDDLNSLGTTQLGIAANPPTAGPGDADTSAPAGENSPTDAEAAVDTAAEAADDVVGKGFFLLVLKNGISYAVTDYWFADGYLEYVSVDSTRGHVPLEALDLQITVTDNSRRGLPFVLRSAPTDAH